MEILGKTIKKEYENDSEKRKEFLFGELDTCFNKIINKRYAETILNLLSKEEIAQYKWQIDKSNESNLDVYNFILSIEEEL